ncbi:hypothetical protein CR513_39717, partial [Mucuna pruriens]
MNEEQLSRPRVDKQSKMFNTFLCFISNIPLKTQPFLKLLQKAYELSNFVEEVIPTLTTNLTNKWTLDVDGSFNKKVYKLSNFMEEVIPTLTTNLTNKWTIDVDRSSNKKESK